MEKQGCCPGAGDSGLACSACEQGEALIYWCETCRHQLAEKRCPGCGLKTKRIISRD